MPLLSVVLIFNGKLITILNCCSQAKVMKQLEQLAKAVLMDDTVEIVKTTEGRYVLQFGAAVRRPSSAEEKQA